MLQQFEKNQGGWINEAFDEDDAVQIMEILDSPKAISGNLRFDVHSLSELHNPEAEMSQAINTYQLFTQYSSDAARFAEVMMKLTPDPQGQAAIAQKISELMVHSIEGMGKMVKKILESAGAEDAEEFVYRLREAGADGQGLITATGQRLRELAQGQAPGAAGAVPGAAMGAIPGGATQPQAAGAGARGSDRIYG
jgi:hypothetical protein